MSKTVIQVENLSKEYQLGVIGHGTLYRDLQSWWARLRGKEDPNAILHDDERKHGDRFWALKDISFEVKEGERLGIIGRNGAGKSTLLKILSRVTTPTSGHVAIKGRVASLLEVGTGFHPELTGRENIFLNGAILGMNRREVQKKFDEIVDFAGVEDYIDTPVKRYSSGMHVRLGFAVAAHLEPDILIVDEVLAVGDIAFQKKCLGKMEDVSKNQGRTVLFVSHNMGMIKNLCSLGMLLVDGRIAESGEVGGVVDKYMQLNLSPEGNPQTGLLEQHFEKEDFRPAQFLSLRLCDTKACGIYTVEDEIELEVEYEVRRFVPSMTLSVVVVSKTAFSAVRGEFFYSYLSDTKPELAKGHPTGHYKARISLPSFFLPPGEYVIKSTMGAPNQPIHSPAAGVAVTIEEQGKYAFTSFGKGRGGLFLRPLDWDVQKLAS